jgi:hypothetical protein
MGIIQRFVTVGVACIGAIGSRLEAQAVRLHPTDSVLTQLAERSAARTSSPDAASRLRPLVQQLRSARVVSTFGREDGEAEDVFGHIAAAALLSSGRLLVLDRSFHAVRVHTPGKGWSMVGRQGSGPLDLRSAMTLWPERENEFAVADGVLGIKYVDVSENAARLNRVVKPGADITGACRRPHGGLAVFRTPGSDNRVVQLFDSSGKAGVAFGSGYPSESAMIRGIMSQGVVGCLSNGRFAFAISGLPFVHIHDSMGRRLWTVRLRDFEVGYQQETIDRSGRRSIGLAEKAQRFSLTLNIVEAADGVALVQVFTHSSNSLRQRRDFEVADTYLVDTNKGDVAYVGSTLPTVSQVTGRSLVTISNDPFPKVAIMELGR